MAAPVEESFTKKAIAQLLTEKEDEAELEQDPQSDIEYDEADEEAGGRPSVRMYYFDCDGTMYGILEACRKATTKGPLADSDQPPWTRPGANPQEYFNFGFDDEKWRLYINKQILMRFEKNLIQKHLTQKEQYERAHTRPEYSMTPPFMPPMYYPQPPYGGH